MPKEALGRFEARGLEARARKGRLAMVTVSRYSAPALRHLRHASGKSLGFTFSSTTLPVSGFSMPRP
jgi:hypothetical protein